MAAPVARGPAGGAGGQGRAAAAAGERAFTATGCPFGWCSDDDDMQEEDMQTESGFQNVLGAWRHTGHSHKWGLAGGRACRVRPGSKRRRALWALQHQQQRRACCSAGSSGRASVPPHSAHSPPAVPAGAERECSGAATALGCSCC